MKKLVPIILALLTSATSFSQNIFSETYPGCNTDRFLLEGDSAIAKIDNEEMLRVINGGLSEKVKEKIKGKIFLQIIVDKNGNSCLISLRNETNIKTKKFKLKESIDSNLKWDIPNRKVAAILLLDFTESEIKYTRLGISKEKGVHVLMN